MIRVYHRGKCVGVIPPVQERPEGRRRFFARVWRRAPTKNPRLVGIPKEVRLTLEWMSIFLEGAQRPVWVAIFVSGEEKDLKILQEAEPDEAIDQFVASWWRRTRRSPK